MPAAIKDSATGRAANEDLVVAIAVNVLAAKGWLEEEPDDALIAALHRLYRANSICQVEVRYTGEPAARHARQPPGRAPRRLLRERVPGGVGAHRGDLDVRLRSDLQGAPRRAPGPAG